MWGARWFLVHVGEPQAFADLPLGAQLAPNHAVHRFVAWLIATRCLRPSPDYLVARRPRLGIILSRHWPVFHALFMNTAATLTFPIKTAQAQWSALAQVCALTGLAPERLTHAAVDAARDELLAAADRYGHESRRGLSTAIFGLEATLFHAGVVDELPRKRGRTKADIRAAQWAKVPERMRTTMHTYLEQVGTTLRPGRVKNVEATLREFAGFVAERDSSVQCVADLGRSHVEAYKCWLAERPALRGGPLHRHTIKDRLCALRGFFTRLLEWEIADAPTRIPVLASDMPIPDDTLPRFLDDAAATKLLQAARADDDPFVRLTVEFLARTGMRKGEYLALTTDAVVQIGSAYWLHVPLGKLHTDRYIPLHPQLKELLDEWLAKRPEELRSKLIFVEQGRPMPVSRVDAAVTKAAKKAGIGRVSPHRLRHTLATQAINRGMSLEAIAALLGHRSFHMTLVYARIADRTVADEYFAVSEKVEALYQAPKQLPADAEGAEMRKLRAEMHRRMLGNGYCARPVGMDCHFESICESCTFFQTTIEFRPTLQMQRDDAATKGQLGRTKIFDGLLARLDQDAS
ncbi:integrase [Mycobacterium asiaticum]|nr:integrase [Mycobacterium asiaticum]